MLELWKLSWGQERLGQHFKESNLAKFWGRWREKEGDLEYHLQTQSHKVKWHIPKFARSLHTIKNQYLKIRKFLRKISISGFFCQIGQSHKLGPHSHMEIRGTCPFWRGQFTTVLPLFPIPLTSSSLHPSTQLSGPCIPLSLWLLPYMMETNKCGGSKKQYN